MFWVRYKIHKVRGYLRVWNSPKSTVPVTNCHARVQARWAAYSYWTLLLNRCHELMTKEDFLSLLIDSDPPQHATLQHRHGDIQRYGPLKTLARKILVSSLYTDVPRSHLSRLSFSLVLPYP